LGDSLTINPGGKLLTTSAEPDTTEGNTDLRLWDVETGKGMVVLDVPKAFIRNISFSIGGTLLAKDGDVEFLYGVPAQ
jgi:WD40 repeat protein